MIGPGFNSIDLSLMKNFRLRENVKLQFRAESFNVFNHPNYQVPIFQLDNSRVGQALKRQTKDASFNSR